MGLKDPCMPDLPCHARNFFLACFAVSLAQGQTIKGSMIRATTVKKYLKAAYLLFEKRSIPFRSMLETDYIEIITTALDDYDTVKDRRHMITDSMTRWLHKEARKHHRDSPLAATVDWILLGRYTGFRKSEWCQSSQDAFARIDHWPGQPSLAIILSDFTFYDKHQRLVILDAQTDTSVIHYVKIRWRHQKNGDNGEIIPFGKDTAHPKFCPVLAAIRIALRALRLGVPADEPIAVCSDATGNRKFITDSGVAKVLRLSATEALGIGKKDPSLKLWSTHSVRVTAANLLHRQQFSDSFIQTRLRWKSSSFLMYLRNTFYAADQHKDLYIADSCLPPKAERTYRAPEAHKQVVMAARAA